MAASSRLMITEAERRFPVRIRIAADQGLGARLDQMHQWLDQNAGADGWAMTPSGTRGVVNDATAIYFADAAIATDLQPCPAGQQRAGDPARNLEDRGDAKEAFIAK